MMARARSPRGEGASLREDIITAAADLLIEHGNETAVSVRAIADRVGVSTPSLYLHFPDRQAILDAVCERVWGQLDEEMEKAALDGQSAIEALHQRGMAYVRFGIANPEHYRIVMMDRRVTDRHADMMLGDTSFNHMLEAVQACIDEGTFPAGSAPMEIGLQLWAVVHGLTSLVIAKPGLGLEDVETLADATLTSIASGIALRPL